MTALLDLKEASNVTGIKPSTLRLYAKAGRIRAYRGPRNRILFKTQDVEAFLQNLPPVSAKVKKQPPTTNGGE